MKVKIYEFPNLFTQISNDFLFMSYWWNDKLLKRSSNSKNAIFHSILFKYANSKLSPVDIHSFGNKWLNKNEPKISKTFYPSEIFYYTTNESFLIALWCKFHSRNIPYSRGKLMKSTIVVLCLGQKKMLTRRGEMILIMTPSKK